MNHPLRHQGDTLYQAEFFPDDKGTILQVVQNPGWRGNALRLLCRRRAGMLIHFGLHLVTFLRRRFAV